ncbi:GlyGly-CTERM sorting domain-containing protein [Vibrio crassostreae]|uniref:DUF3466 family protein n=1 Tax=Vibrio crassostreae TaxID=246167 RepID=UPI001B3129CB|nr:DUF3466 family protein [Vibrio crassostreae]CAK1819299.1 GlyGly-CTERM sorting domain-containing protein [Vibrio crassostreae]CAK1821347.1 GlyGly-CTERM sorting domain-containing protein [Vibrio crassostreae]CAK1823590.1 GlyGly-CTERM sorting domain-containing protein [Vibrio crassostreae]CAK1828057.1 GlyGly-CTERM sorting domain-containing protein [Vibrio crassostreae]CAK1832575.1 GlyGly-CTERM sorting domain-containing protein [Vibrio crassostreae]
MTCTKFKLTTVAALVFAATNANAALYKVVEVTPSITGASEIFGVAIQPATVSGTESCFTTGTVGGVACDSFKLAGETRNAIDGIGYREEVPFAMDAPFQYIQERDDFENYCYRELRYSTCESWADNRWATWSKESDLSYVNAKAFVGEGGSSISSFNVSITGLDDSGAPLGIESNGNDVRYNAVTTVPLTASSESRAWGALTVNDGTTDIVYNFGSISVQGPKTDTSDTTFSSKAAIWKDGEVHQFIWKQGDIPQTGDYFAQGSMRGLAENSGKLYGVGFDTVNGNGDLQDMNASVFVSDALDITGATWETKIISGAEVKSGSSNDDARYSNSVATDINDNLFAVGYSKRNGYVPESGSAGNKPFVVTDAKNPTATYLSGGIFFGGSSGEAKAVNNFNEFVGQIDAETTREVDGSERRHRGFIYPYNVSSSTEARRVDIFNGQAWWLDDLTNDGNVSGENNKFRIIDATDINDAGVISATAIKCTVGGTTQPYDTTSHNSYCGGASSNAVEEVVAVKLVPIAGATKADIQTRSADSEKVDRQGGSLGWLTLTVLGLLGFRRKFK